MNCLYLLFTPLPIQLVCLYMNNAFFQSLIQASRAQMKALDICLAELEKQLAEPVVDTTLRCQNCQTELTDNNSYTVMGAGLQYACPGCEWRGAL